jgi:Fur family transcriptional regulator, ferric uptake regulator
VHHGRAATEPGGAEAALPSASVTELDDIALHRLRQDGQRLTTGRRLILSTLRDVGAPVTIPDILRHEPSLAQSSVYRNLSVLECAGLVSKISMGDEHAHYELGEAITNHHHHHLVCTRCGRVSDVTLSAEVEHSLDAALRAAASVEQFELHHHRLDLLGLCGACTG